MKHFLSQAPLKSHICILFSPTQSSCIQPPESLPHNQELWINQYPKRTKSFTTDAPQEQKPQDHYVTLISGGFTTEQDRLPRGYYYSPSFLGTFAAASLSQSSAEGAYSFVGPILADIGADVVFDNIIWVTIIYTLGVDFGLLLFGRITDIFRRRYFMIGGSVISLVGALICATAHSVPVLVGGGVFLGLGAAPGI
jgi:hypothetical protein